MELVVAIILFVFVHDVSPYTQRNQTCGVDNSKASMVYEGAADIETYPWMGVLFYDTRKNRVTTAVILITKQLVLGSAVEIDELPKESIRRRSRVILGQKCRGPGIRVRDYTFHPDYKKNSHSALALVQLEVDQVQIELRPICPPPAHFISPTFYAMTLSKDCYKGKIRIFEMTYVNPDKCVQFYRKSGLDVGKFWTPDTACARALYAGGRCRWRSGTALVVKQGGRWRLLGFGMYGPGCQSPARFLDYGKYHEWVHNSVSKIGLPAITRMGGNHIVMRRTLSSVQRFGPCDPEETKYEMYTDLFVLRNNKSPHWSTASYNVSLYHDVEYSCIVLRAISVENIRHYPDGSENPRIHLRRWCAGPPTICYGFQYVEINFFLEIEFSYDTSFSLAAYGKIAKSLSPQKVMKYANSYKLRPRINRYEEVLGKMKRYKGNEFNRWFYWSDHQMILNPVEDTDWYPDKNGVLQFYYSGGLPSKKLHTYWIYNNTIDPVYG